MIIRKTQLAVILSVLLLSASFVWADPNLWQDEWNSLANEPGAKITTGKDTNGDETRDILLPGKVSIHETRHGDKVQTVAQDISGHGAVMCAWGIYITLRSYIDVCPVDATGDNKLKTVLDDAISRMNDFIVTNSNTGTTREALQGEINKQVRAAKEKSSGLLDDERAKKCASGDTAKMLDRLRTTPPDTIKKNIDDLLSVPRPPVVNPCL